MAASARHPRLIDPIADGSLRAARIVLPLAIDALSPSSLLDVSFAGGPWSAVARDLGIPDVTALGESPELGDLESFDLGRRFDLVTALDVADRLPEPSAAGLVERLVRHGDVILLCAAIPGEGGQGNANEQWPDYWAALFAQYGYLAVDYLRPRLWRDPGVDPSHAQNLLLYVSGERLQRLPALAAAAQRSGLPLSVVHPKVYEAARERGATSNPLAPVERRPAPAPAAPAQLALVVYSKDRPAQLELLLRSVKRFFAGWEEVDWSVVFTASDPDYDRGYARVRAEHPEFRYVDEREHECSFKELTLELIGQSPFVAFGVDDDVFKEPFELDTPEFHAFVSDPEIACLSLRMCPRLDRCYTMNELTAPPPFERGTVWRWLGEGGDWGYPMSLEFHIFRREQILPLISELEFFNPNSFEAGLATRPHVPPKMICFSESKIVNLPVNRVQDTFPNRHSGTHSQQDLNDGFVAGRRLALGPIAGFRNVSVHQEMELSWEGDEEAPASEPQATQHDQAPRGFVTVAYVEEALEAPELLASYQALFGHGDDATLVLYGPDGDPHTVEPIRLSLEAAGLEAADAPHAQLLVVGAAAGDAALPTRAGAVLSGREPRRGFEWLPHFDADGASMLRRVAEAHWQAPRRP